MGIQLLPDGSRHVVRLQVATDATVIDALFSRDAGPTFVIVAGDDVYYLVAPQTDLPANPRGARREGHGPGAGTEIFDAMLAGAIGF